MIALFNFQPSAKNQKNDNDVRCHSIASSCRSNTFTFPADAKKVSTPRTWLLTDRENKKARVCYTEDTPDSDDSEIKQQSNRSNGIVTVCEVNGTCVNVFHDGDSVRQGTAV